MKKILILMFATLFITSVSADECEPKLVYLDSVKIQQGYWRVSDTCWVSISARTVYKMTYRNYLITSDGLIHVFNSFGEGPHSTYTGAREIHILPNDKQVGFKVLDDRIDVSMANGDIFSFDIVTGEPINLGKGNFYVDPEVQRNNKGGFEITSYDGLILDSGFRLGMSPTWYLDRYSTFRDLYGTTCRVKNSEVFDKKSGESFWIYNNYSQLTKYLQKRCPSLTL